MSQIQVSFQVLIGTTQPPPHVVGSRYGYLARGHTFHEVPSPLQLHEGTHAGIASLGHLDGRDAFGLLLLSGHSAGCVSLWGESNIEA